MNLQALVDKMNADASRERAKYHLTLGGLVNFLKETDTSLFVVYDNGFSPSSPLSYRGYYCDLSFPPSSTPITVKELLAEAEASIGATFEGYKGGDFTMSKSTPLWASHYGEANGMAIINARVIDGRVVLTTKQID